MEKYDDRPIGVFDSGQGGLTVLSRIVDLMPNENYVFYGDSGHAPYGTKTIDEVYQLSKNVVDHLIDEYNVKAIMIACNTATSAAAKRLRSEYDLPIIGIEPAVKPAVIENPDKHVVVMATPLTLREEKFVNLVHKYAKPSQVVKVPAPKLVEFVENSDIDSENVYEYLHSLLDDYVGKTTGVVLGCTHFPFARKAIVDVLGQDIKVYDGAVGAAAEVKRQVKKHSGLTSRKDKGTIIFENSKQGGVEISKKLYRLFRNNC